MNLKEGMEKLDINIEVTLNRFMNNEGMYLRFLRKSADDPTFAMLSKAVETKDYKEIEINAHTLKGVAGNLGFEELMDSCAKLVADVRTEKYESIEEEFSKTAEIYGKIIEVIREIDA